MDNKVGVKHPTEIHSQEEFEEWRKQIERNRYTEDIKELVAVIEEKDGVN